MQGTIEKLKKLTGCSFIKLLNSGDAAILCALYVVKRRNIKLQIPDQGGWLTYQRFPNIFDLDVEEIKTDYGRIKQCSEAVLVCNPAGYFAEQDLKYIRKKSKLMILDASGSIGKETGDADIVIGSFGEWKPVDLGTGGFFATNNRDYYDCAKELFPALKFEGDHDLLLKKLNNLSNRYKLFDYYHWKIKDDLKHLDIIHKNKKGIN
ncbi:hypothetical protein KY312_04415, partial [Candidatus Woesearchaeota archaeon]|nr:hypothetical protein [Candidatus Woesearchaeota archaeon]